MATPDVASLPDDLRRLIEQVVEQAEAHPDFAAALAARLGRPSMRRRAATPGSARRPKHRRAPGPFDPFAVMTTEGGDERALREQLKALTVEQLKDMVAEHAMDTTKLATKWKKPDRLIELIVSTVQSRLAKGSAFRGP